MNRRSGEGQNLPIFLRFCVFNLPQQLTLTGNNNISGEGKLLGQTEDAKTQGDEKERVPLPFFSPPPNFGQTLTLAYHWLPSTVWSFFEFIILVSYILLLYQQISLSSTGKMERAGIKSRQYKCYCSVLRWNTSGRTTSEKIKTRHPR